MGVGWVAAPVDLLGPEGWLESTIFEIGGSTPPDAIDSARGLLARTPSCCSIHYQGVRHELRTGCSRLRFFKQRSDGDPGIPEMRRGLSGRQAIPTCFQVSDVGRSGARENGGGDGMEVIPFPGADEALPRGRASCGVSTGCSDRELIG